MTAEKRTTVTREADSTPQEAFAELVEIMARLRGPEGCPWDREQDHRSLRRCLLEETYEVLEAVDAEDWDGLRQELGDLLLQVVFHAQLASEAGRFDITDVVQGLRDKLVSRHPHVFGDEVIETADAVVNHWEAQKRRERGETIAQQMAKVPRALPSLARAQTVQKQAARAGREISASGARRELETALRGLEEGAGQAEQSVGRMLFAVADLARLHGVDAEQALREEVGRFIARTAGNGSPNVAGGDGAEVEAGGRR